MKIVMIVLLCVIWYLIIGAFVSAGLLKWTGEDLDDEDATLRVAVMILWPFALIYMLITRIGYALSKLPTGAYNLMNKPKKEKKEATTIYDDYDEKKKYTAITTTEDYPLPAWYTDENGRVKRENALAAAYKKMSGNAEILEIMEAIDEATDECEKRYGIKIKGVTDIFSVGDGKTYIDFVADNGGTYCLEIPMPVKDWQRRRELLRRCNKYKGE